MSSPIQPAQSSIRPAYQVDISNNDMPIISGHLKMGGKNRAGHSIELTNYYLVQDGKIVIPVMGEFHFSRYARAFWEEELLKIKAGGVDIVATYVFWIHVEEEEGIFNWSGNNDLHAFAELCDKCGLQALVRIGPFAHGECRNGGIPDWMYGRPFQVRSNDPRYLEYVTRLYDQIAQQLEGLLFKDNGPVIGIQLDNEYMHCGAPWEVTYCQGMEWVPSGSEGAGHIQKLKELALNAGFDVPLYTVTGWIRSPILEGETLPMQGGYVFQPWNPDPTYQQPPTREYIFRNRHLNPVLDGEPTYEAANYPFMCCEMGGGTQISYYHRPIVPAEAVESLAVMNLAGGANLIGYYMYHGGTNPVGKHAYLNEYTVPRISYDFQAPIREFGQFNDSFRSLRLLHQFLKDFGDVLAPMTVSLPENAGTIMPEDIQTLRYGIRSNGSTGFVFLNNYQDHVETQAIDDVCIEIHASSETIAIPNEGAIVLEKGVTAILPFGLSLEGVVLRYATTQLLAKIEAGDAVNYFFFAPQGMSSEYAFDAATLQSLSVQSGEIIRRESSTIVSVIPGLDCMITLENLSGKTVRIFTLTRDQAERCSKQSLWGRDRIVISDSTLVTDGDSCWLYSIGHNDVDMLVYPAVERHLATPFGGLRENQEGGFTRYSGSVPSKSVQVAQQAIVSDRIVLTFPADVLEQVNNVILQIDYEGDIGYAYVDGKLIHDHFNNGLTWEIGLKQVGQDLLEKEMVILVTPIVQNSVVPRYVPTGMAFRPDSNGQIPAVIREIRAVAEYKIPIQLA
ncbi:MAG: beta-galactosidase [Chloroflexota bacterium]